MAKFDDEVDALLSKHPVGEILRCMAGVLSQEALNVQNEGHRVAVTGPMISSYVKHYERLMDTAKELRRCARKIHM